MTSAGDFLSRLADRLNEAGIPYMLAGSFASSYHGVPRTTQDLDLVIDPTAATLEDLLDALPEEDYYFSREAAGSALLRRSQFNVIDLSSGWKADLIIRKNRGFSRTEFERRLQGEVLGAEVSIATAEDTVLAKLEWAVKAESERQLRDVAGVLAVSQDLDMDYLQHWVQQLDLEETWERARQLASGS
jgi:hypothetical protein